MPKKRKRRSSTVSCASNAALALTAPSEMSALLPYSSAMFSSMESATRKRTAATARHCPKKQLIGGSNNLQLSRLQEEEARR